MKNELLLLLTVLILFSLNTFCKKNSTKAMEYNNVIAEEMKRLSDIEQEIAIKDGPELDTVIEKFKSAVPEAKSNLEKLGSFENDDSLQKAAIQICNFYQEVIDGNWSGKGQDAIREKDAELETQLKQVQTDFAKKFGFEIK